MIKIVTKKTTLASLYKGTKYLKYKDPLYYGWGAEKDHRKIYSLIPNIWPNDDTINYLNELCELDDKKKAKLLNYSKKSKNLTAIALLQDKKAPVAIVAAGGGYSCVCSAVESFPVASYLYKKGYSTFTITYSILDKAKMGGAIDDVAECIAYLTAHQKELNIDMDEYIIGGFSAGGHCIGELLTDNYGFDHYKIKKPKLLFLGYPVITFTSLTCGGTRRCCIGENPSQELIDQFSIEKHIVNQGVKVFHWQCQRDNTVPFENTLLLREALKKANVDFISKDYDSDAHGWGIGTGKLADGWVDEMLEFLNY